MKEILKIIGMLIWILGGGMIIAFIFIGLPILLFGFIGIEAITWIWNHTPQIVIAIIILLFLIWGFTKKTNDPLHW